MSTTFDPSGSDAGAAPLAHVLSLTADTDQPVAHDLSNEHESAFLRQLATRGGMTPERYPGLFSLLNGTRTMPAYTPDDGGATYAAGAADSLGAADAEDDDPTGNFVSGQVVDFVGVTPDTGVAHAMATFTRTNPIDTATVWLQVVNDNEGVTTVVASGQYTGFLEQTLKVVTDHDGAEPLPQEGTTTAVLSWAVQYTDGSSEVNSQGIPWAFATDGDPTVKDPKQNPNRTKGDLTAIVVGLSRGWNSPANNTDVDYWFWQKQWDNTTLLVQLSGSMRFKYPIAPLGSGNPSLEFYLARKEGGMKDLKAQKIKQYLPFFSIDPNDPRRLNFSLVAGSDSAGNAINFGVSPWVADTRTFFTARVLVNFTAGSRVPTGWSSIVSSEKPDTDPTDGVAFIKPLVYVWHCLAAGTQVSLPDGTTRAIEDFNAGDQVQSASGPRAVMATLAQPHWGTVFVITTASGRSITCSGTHPFYSGGPPVQASTLAVGQMVETEAGAEAVASITRQQQNGEGLFNLWLDPAGGGGTTFVANGFVVGDYQVQVQLLDALENPVTARARLPEHLQTDFDSFLEDRAAAAGRAHAVDRPGRRAGRRRALGT
ncbi:MAG TPA: Hint domain-containing protein, partial [Longimicrobium sp.]|nr:Hint domain-containing protein [Longimicrobium sp.]